jgi:uncharacterized membrane protein YjfL (UPF0719 family)
MLFANAALDLFWLVISVVFAVVALYIAFALLGKITPDINEEKELAGGNVAVGIVVASVFVAVAIVVESGVTGLSVGLNKALDVGFFTGDGLLFVGSAFAQLILGIALAVIAIYLAISIFERLTHGVGEFEDLRKGNVAVALEMAGIIIAVAVIIQSGVLGITAALV